MAKPDPESHLLVAALARRGIVAELVPWDSAQAWASYRLVVVRTPWDYFARLDEFLAWARHTSALTDFVNPLPVIEWNSHKAYLRELQAGGVATVPTLWLGRGAADAVTQLRNRGWDEVVVKPAVSIGAIGALRARAADPVCARHVEQLVAEGDVMIQPFVASVAAVGEVSLIYFGGAFSHSIRKQPAPGDFRVQDMYGGTVHAHAPSAAGQVPRHVGAQRVGGVDVIVQASFIPRNMAERRVGESDARLPRGRTERVGDSASQRGAGDAVANAHVGGRHLDLVSGDERP